MNLEFVRNIRERELSEVVRYLPPSSRAAKLLEVGAGSGWQSKILAEQGWQVSAIDIETSNYVGTEVFHVARYDGVNLPFPDNEFDVVFSSNVLEHVPHVQQLLAETHRVLKPGGVAVHVLPTTTWRWLTSVAHYPALIKLLFSLIITSFRRTSTNENNTQGKLGDQSWGTLIRRALHSGRHGEIGNEITELYHFSRFRWNHEFSVSGWFVEQRHGMGLTYTGYAVFGSWLPFSAREFLSRIFGSACHLYILKKDPPKQTR